jgi:uncharacterized protein (DUF2235 family)/LysM repeat protein
MRRLVFCFDGSWNKLDTKEHPTNVVLVAESVLPEAEDGTPQIVYYDEGVGTGDSDEVRGGAFGQGLVQNIREAYRFLIFNYLPGDEIFVFGFSRGAFTARSFIGFIRAAGVLSVNDANQIKRAWKLYDAHADRADEESEELLRFRAEYCPGLCITEHERAWRTEASLPCADPATPILRIRYCGVWDTVGSLGVVSGIKAVFDRSTDKDAPDHDVELSDTVEAGRHALALDERRVHFMPTLWRNVDALNRARNVASDATTAPFQQKWFAGDHGSVGGGGPERGLSNAALAWVLKGAIVQVLEVKLDGRSRLGAIRYDARAPLHNTPEEGIQSGRLGLGLLGKAVDAVKDAALTEWRGGPDIAADIHPSALRRWFKDADQLPEKRAYRPEPLLRHTAAIEEQRAVFVPLETKSAADARTHVVQPGESLWRIARSRLDDRKRGNDIFMLNRDLLDDPDDLYPGDILRLPPEASPDQDFADGSTTRH